jgi:hypothetical protein
MKSKIKNLSILLVIFLSWAIFPKQAIAQQGNVSFQVFYDQLSPYGQWVNYSNYGYVWMPDAGSDFVPYSTEGHWILTDYGWTWVSDYNWGWAPFHYGRWDYDNFYGWFWVPGNEWGPSWVTWRRADGYYGWEPMQPGISISISFGRAYNNHNDHWIFVRDRDIERSNINHYNVNRADHDRIARNSTVINKTRVDNSRHSTYVSGPAKEDVQKATGRWINPVAIHDNNKPGQNLSNGKLQIYRPQVSKTNDKQKRPAPSKVTNMKDMKKPSERGPANQSQNIKSQDNSKKDQQNKASKPTNTNGKAQPSQTVKSNPSNNGNKQQQNNSKPANTGSKAQPSQTVKSNPSSGNGNKQQQNNSKPTNTGNKTQPSQTVKSNPSSGNGNKQQQNNSKPTNTGNKTQPSQTVKSRPSSNNGGGQNNNNKVQPSQTQRSNTSGNNREKQQNNAAQQGNNKNAQPKESRSGPDKK